MNSEPNKNNEAVTPYKASKNLNTMIGNPSIQVNDTMNVNIQNIQTAQINNTMQSTETIPNTIPNNGINQPNPPEVAQIINNNVASSETNNLENSTPAQNINQMNSEPNKKYVAETKLSNKKKKTSSFNLGPEFKIALLIVVILLVFIFLLPVISDLLRNH